MTLCPLVKSLTLKRFRSFKNAQVEFDNPTFLVGQNGSGKSNLVDAFAFLAESMAGPLSAAIDKRGGISAVRFRPARGSGASSMGLGVALGSLNDETTAAHYAFQIEARRNERLRVIREQCQIRRSDGERYWFDRQEDGFVSNVAALSPALDSASLALPVIGGHAQFACLLRTLAAMRVYCINPTSLRYPIDADSNGSLRGDGGNAAAVLDAIRRESEDVFETLRELLASIVPGMIAATSHRRGDKLTIEFLQESAEGRLSFDAASMSDGTLRAMALLLAAFQHPSPSVMVIEEPEASMHPGALGAVLDMLRHASLNTQLVVTTQSTDLLDAEWIEDRHLRIVTNDQGQSHVAGLADSSRSVLRDRLMRPGELLRANALDPAPPGPSSESDASELFEELA
ncbi:MAG: AAA family ATPase [Pirellulales bacterium]